MSDTATERETLARVLREEGFDTGGSHPHSWRCEHPDRYPDFCDCVESMVNAILAAGFRLPTPTTDQQNSHPGGSMSEKAKKCARCGERAETRDNLAETTFWGFIETETEIVTSESVRLVGTHVRGHGSDSRILSSDEKRPLCSPCWGLLVGHFMQGRPVAPVKHEHEWKPGGRSGGYPLERCGLCLQDRISHTQEEA